MVEIEPIRRTNPELESNCFQRMFVCVFLLDFFSIFLAFISILFLHVIFNMFFNTGFLKEMIQVKLKHFVLMWYIIN